MRPYTIAIDGPAGAGKSTVARLLARRLGYLYVDSGAMYRAVAFKTRLAGVEATDSDAVAALARSIRITFVPTDEEEQRVCLDDDDVTGAIRTPEIASLASVVSAIPGVRSALVSQQQHLGNQGGVVMEGRDIGTVVFPHAELKIFLTASPEERAERRYRDIMARGGDTSVAAVRMDQDERDKRDANRTVSPLAPAADAVEMTSDGRTPDEIVTEVLELLNARRQGIA